MYSNPHYGYIITFWLEKCKKIGTEIRKATVKPQLCKGGFVYDTKRINSFDMGSCCCLLNYNEVSYHKTAMDYVYCLCFIGCFSYDGLHYH